MCKIVELFEKNSLVLYKNKNKYYIHSEKSTFHDQILNFFLNQLKEF